VRSLLTKMTQDDSSDTSFADFDSR